MAATSTHSAGSASATSSSQSSSSQSVSRSPTAAASLRPLQDHDRLGLVELRSRAASSSGLYSITLFGSTPQLAATTTMGLASSIRAASSAGANPPKTTECTAPRRAHASIAITASGTIGM